MKQEIEQVVAGGAGSIEKPIEQECSVQHRPDHVIKMSNKRVPPVEMGVDKNCIEVVVLKGAAKSAGVGSRGNRNEKSTDEQGAHREAIHGVVILHRALMV